MHRSKNTPNKKHFAEFFQRWNRNVIESTTLTFNLIRNVQYFDGEGFSNNPKLYFYLTVKVSVIWIGKLVQGYFFHRQLACLFLKDSVLIFNLVLMSIPLILFSIVSIFLLYNLWCCIDVSMSCRWAKGIFHLCGQWSPLNKNMWIPVAINSIQIKNSVWFLSKSWYIWTCVPMLCTSCSP